MLKNSLLSAINAGINHYLQMDPESSVRLAKLHGRTIAIECLPFGFIFHCVFSPQGVTVQTADESLVAETYIRGTPWHMAGAMMTRENRHRFFAEDLVIEGDAELGQQVVNLFDELHIDWEEHCARVIGDVPAYHLGRFTKRAGSLLKDIGDSFRQNVSEYVHEEAEWLPAREALQDFFNDIDTLRMDVDRAEARILALKQPLASQEGAA